MITSERIEEIMKARGVQPGRRLLNELATFVQDQVDAKARELAAAYGDEQSRLIRSVDIADVAIELMKVDAAQSDARHWANNLKWYAERAMELLRHAKEVQDAM